MRTHTHIYTPTLNHNHSCRERESERSTVAKSQNALHFSLRHINQFLPARHNLPQGWIQSKRHQGFPKRHRRFSPCPVSCRASNTVNILISHWEKTTTKKRLFPVLNTINPVLTTYSSSQSSRGDWNCKSNLLLSTLLFASNSAILQNNALWKEIHQWFAVQCHWSESKDSTHVPLTADDTAWDAVPGWALNIYLVMPLNTRRAPSFILHRVLRSLVENVV